MNWMMANGMRLGAVLRLTHALAFACALAGAEWGGTAAGANLQTWQRWEQALTSTCSYPNPYADVTLRVIYTGPGNRIMRAYGFWDGADTFRIRCAFPTPGLWRWETECSDASNAGLHRQRGQVEVAEYWGDSSLYRRGFLKVSDDRRHLAYADGTPFLWMGDTAWAVPHRASDDEWEAYIADRRAKHFTVIQVAPAPGWAGETNRQGQRPFTDKACTQWNPAYWQSFESKIQRATEQDLVVLLVGLMEPVHRYPEAAQARLFARNIVARLFGNFVVFSPSFDSEVLPLAHEVGRAARDATAVHLITQHPGTPWNQPTPTFSDQYYDQPYLDIAAVQTGHNAGHLDWCAHHAIEWWRLVPAHDLVRNQPEDVTRRMVLAKSGSGDLVVAYLPDDEAIEIDMSIFPAPLRARWFDPVHGRYVPIAKDIQTKRTHRFVPPAKGDWVLILQGKGK